VNGQPVDLLIRDLKDWSSDVRKTATEALVQIGSPAVDPLIRALGDELKLWADVKALFDIGINERTTHDVVIYSLGGNSLIIDIRPIIVKVLGQLGNVRAVEPLIGALRDNDVRQAAIEALVQIGTSALEPLIYALGDDELVRAAAEALGHLGDIRAVDPLIRALRDEKWYVREIVAEALGRIGAPRAVEPLIHALGDNNTSMDVKRAAAEALGKLGDDRAIMPLIRAMRGVGIPWMSHMEHDSVKALVQIGPSAIEPLIFALGHNLDSFQVKAAINGLVQLCPPAIEPLIRALEDDDKYIRHRAAIVLGQSGDIRAVEQLIHSLGDKYMPLRCAAAEALGQLGDTRAVDPLIYALEDEHYWPMVRDATKALGQLGDPRAFEPLIRILGEYDHSRSRYAAEALGQLGDTRAVEPLIQTLENEDFQLDFEAAKALGQLGDARAIDPLIRTLGRRARKAAAEGLRQLGEGIFADAVMKAFTGNPHIVIDLGDTRAVEPLVLALEDGDVRRPVAETLGQLRNARAVEPLITILEDESKYVRVTAVKALEQLGDTRAVKPLTGALKDNEKEVSQAATEAITTLCNQNQRYLSASWKKVLCAEHLTRFTFHNVSLPVLKTTGYYACRVCQRDDLIIKPIPQVTAVLDTGMSQKQTRVGDTLRVNWLKRNTLFDFECVEITNANDLEVERFCVQVGNDLDSFRKPRYQKMSCTVDSLCDLSQNTLKILKHTFQEVLVIPIRKTR